MNSRSRLTGPLLAIASALVGYRALCKMLLFHNLEYPGSDLYGLLDQSRSWLYSGRVLQDNAYGNQAAIHNYYLLPLLSPLTVWLGAYGFFLVLALLELLAAARLASSRALDTPGRLAALAGLVSPLAFFALDDPQWGFHPEALYPSLAVLLTLALLEKRRGQSVFFAVLIILVKEDGAVVCGGVLAAHYVLQLWLARSAPGPERRRIVLRAAAALGAVAAALVLGFVFLWWVAHGAAAEQSTANDRIGRAWGILYRTLRPGAPAARRGALLELLEAYAAAALLLLLPLGARATRGLLLLLAAGPPLLMVLVVSGAHYKFSDPLLAQRVATLLALVVACVTIAGASADAGSRTPRLGWSAGWALGLVALSWALQLGLLGRLGYPLRERIDVPALWSGRGYVLSTVPVDEARLWRCVAARLPGGTAVSLVPELRPFFHRQSIVFPGIEGRTPPPARFRVFRREPAVPSRTAAACPGPRLRDLVADVDCGLEPLLAPCGWTAPAD